MVCQDNCGTSIRLSRYHCFLQIKGNSSRLLAWFFRILAWICNPELGSQINKFFLIQIYIPSFWSSTLRIYPKWTCLLSKGTCFLDPVAPSRYSLFFVSRLNSTSSRFGCDLILDYGYVTRKRGCGIFWGDSFCFERQRPLQHLQGREVLDPTWEKWVISVIPESPENMATHGVWRFAISYFKVSLLPRVLSLTKQTCCGQEFSLFWTSTACIVKPDCGPWPSLSFGCGRRVSFYAAKRGSGFDS